MQAHSSVRGVRAFASIFVAAALTLAGACHLLDLDVNDEPAARDGGALTDDGALDTDASDSGADTCACDAGNCDPSSCGAAHLDCRGGACCAGQCLPLALASGEADPLVLRADDDTLYWINEGDPNALRMLRKSGGGARDLLDASSFGAGAPALLAVADDRIYFAQVASLSSLSLSDGSVSSIDTPAAPVGIAADDSGAYVVTGGLVVYRYGDGGSFQASMSHMTNVELRGDLAVMGGFTATGSGGIWSAPKTCACKATPLYAAGAHVQAMAVDDAGVYWTEQNSTSLYELIGFDAGGGPFASATNNAGSIAVDDRWVYWANNVPNGFIARVARDGSGAAILASGQVNPHSIVVDATFIYWLEGTTNGNDGKVLRLTKPN